MKFSDYYLNITLLAIVFKFHVIKLAMPQLVYLQHTQATSRFIFAAHSCRSSDSNGRRPGDDCWDCVIWHTQLHQ